MYITSFMKEKYIDYNIVAYKQKEHKMQPHIRELAIQIQQALLALPNERLLETAEQWLAPLYEQCDDLEFIIACYEALGYRPCSAVTGQLYESGANLDEAEPETLDFSWVTPEPQALRERLYTMPAEQFYYQVIDLAGQELSGKSFAWDWGAPPDHQNTGETFLPSLLGYLILRKEAATLPAEQFEREYREQLEALAVPVQEVEEEFPQEDVKNFPASDSGIFASCLLQQIKNSSKPLSPCCINVERSFLKPHQEASWKERSPTFIGTKMI